MSYKTYVLTWSECYMPFAEIYGDFKSLGCNVTFEIYLTMLINHMLNHISLAAWDKACDNLNFKNFEAPTQRLEAMYRLDEIGLVLATYLDNRFTSHNLYPHLYSAPINVCSVDDDGLMNIHITEVTPIDYTGVSRDWRLL